MSFARREFVIYTSALLALGVSVVIAIELAWGKWIDFFSLVGTGTGIFGILIAIEQTLQTKSAAIAADNAAKEVAVELRREFYRFSLLDARRLFGEATAFFDSRKWDRASLRLRDLADRLSQLAYGQTDVDEEWEQATKAIRYWSAICAAGVNNRQLEHDSNSWTVWCCFIQKKIDRECGPFDLTSTEGIVDAE